MVIAAIYIVITGTANHPNMHMNAEELMESKKLARLIVLLEVSIILGCVLLGASMIYTNKSTLINETSTQKDGG